MAQESGVTSDWNMESASAYGLGHEIYLLGGNGDEIRAYDTLTGVWREPGRLLMECTLSSVLKLWNGLYLIGGGSIPGGQPKGKFQGARSLDGEWFAIESVGLPPRMWGSVTSVRKKLYFIGGEHVKDMATIYEGELKVE